MKTVTLYNIMCIVQRFLLTQRKYSQASFNKFIPGITDVEPDKKPILWIFANRNNRCCRVGKSHAVG